MEYAETAAPRPLEDGHDLFRRVWARVMPEDRVDCPFLVLPVPEPEDVPPDAKAALPALPPAPEGPAPLCLGPACAPCLPLLRELAAGKLDLARAYRSMARQAGGGTGRTLSALAGDEELLPYITPSFRRRQAAARKMLTEDGAMFCALFEANPYSHEAVRQYRQMLNVAAGGDIDLLCRRARWWWREEEGTADGEDARGKAEPSA